jgi:hypothetical protein
MTDAQRNRAVAPLTGEVAALRQDETLSAYGRRVAGPERRTLRTFARAIARRVRPLTKGQSR